MATYNGGRYIGEQLESLADQSHLPEELVVGDDGSTDGTLEILEDFRERAPFPVRVQRNGENLGYAQNFLSTAQRCKGDWISFCDQDDVWLPNKLADVARAVARTPQSCMVLQNAWLCDKDLVSRNRKFPDFIRSGVYGQGTQYGFWVWPGFLKTIHSSTINLLTGDEMPRSWFPRDGKLTHDKWTCLIANAIGGIVVLDEPVALYRRHEAALTGDFIEKTIGERVRQSRTVSADHYKFLADVAADCAIYMKCLSDQTDSPKLALSLLNNSKDFHKLEKTQRLRARLYLEDRRFQRLLLFFAILYSSGYFGSPFTAMGSRSAVKDAVRVVLGAT
ncbi:MAG: Glycosyl transferase family 2 [Halomonas sp. HL-93]|nr:MAG: Glycosyl transferase family 2 [Halomonas sp. HL-93]